jgi:hypothetical protein
MPHLEQLRKGWENEHLATFLLSRISFVANPIKVADDVGTDLFCCLFEITKGQLFPRSSFAIQLKSSKERIDASSKIEYFDKLELPFFVGVVDQAKLRLSIYSGEYLPIFFSHYGRPQDLKLSLEDTQIAFDNYCDVRPGEKYALRMPFVLDLEAEDDRESIVSKAQVLVQLCSRMLQNISTKVICEYVFKLGDVRPVIFAGRGSAVTFRDNFYYRLAEAFRNLEWLHRYAPQQFNSAECEIYERCYIELRKIVQGPAELEIAYQLLRQRLGRP